MTSHTSVHGDDGTLHRREVVHAQAIARVFRGGLYGVIMTFASFLSR